MANKAYEVSFNDEAVETSFYNDVVSLAVDENVSMASTAQLRLNVRKGDDGTWTWLEDDRFGLFKKFSVRIGFMGGGGLAGALSGAGGGGNDGLERVFDGYITEVGVDWGSDPGDSHLELRAMDTSVLMSMEEKIAVWPNLSDSDIAQQIVSAYGVRVDAESTSTVHSENDTTVVQRASDIHFVRELARRNGCEFYFETDKDSGEIVASFKPPQLGETPQPVLAIQFGEESNLRALKVAVAGRRPLNVKVQQTDIKQASPNSAEAGSVSLTLLGATDDASVIGDGLGAAVTPKESAAAMLLFSPASDSGELQTLAQSVRDEAGWLIHAEGEINSDAYQHVLRPRRLVLIKGAGTPHSGKYYVTRVRHEMSADGAYVQRFEARRNARDVDGSEDFGGDTSALGAF
jgi:phage protein D